MNFKSMKRGYAMKLKLGIFNVISKEFYKIYETFNTIYVIYSTCYAIIKISHKKDASEFPSLISPKGQTSKSFYDGLT